MLDHLIETLKLSGWLADVVAVAVIIVLTVVAAYAARFIFGWVVSFLTEKTATTLDDIIVKATKPEIIRLVYLSGALTLNHRLEGKYTWYGEIGSDIVVGVLYVLIVWVITFYLIRLISILTEWYGSNIAAHTESTFDDELMPLIRRVVSILLSIIGIMVILDHFSVDIKGLVAVLGVGSLAIALAAQETLSNMIGGFVLMVDRPFRKGDRIKLGDGTKCDVYQIGMRSTKFLTFENTLIIVPNAELIKMTINNLTYPEPRIRVKVDVGVAYGSDIDQVSEILLAVAKDDELVLDDPAPQAQFREMADSSLNFSLVCRVQEVSQQWGASLRMRANIYKRFAQEGIEIPFPQRVVHLVDASATSDDGKADKARKTAGTAQVKSLLDRARRDSRDNVSLENEED